MTWVVEISGYDIANDVETIKRFSFGAGIALLDVPYIEGLATEWTSPSQKIDVARTGGVTLSGDNGGIVLANIPPTDQDAGPLDAMMDWAWNGRAASLYWAGISWSTATLIATGTLEQPISDIDAKTIRFPLRDPRNELNVPLQPTKYAGTNTAGAGVEGEADLKGKVKPIMYGVVSNIPGVLVNRSKLIFQLSDAEAAVLCVRDGAIALTAGTARASLVTLEANTPSPGFYDYYAGAEGLFVRLGGQPIFAVSFDAREGANAAARTHAQIWYRIRTNRCGTLAGDIIDASVTATDTADPEEVGFWWVNETTRLEAVNAVLSSLSGYEVRDFDGDWAIARLLAPSGLPVFEFHQMSQAVELTTLMRSLTSIKRARPNYAPDGIPPYRIKVNWGRNYSVMSAADLAGGALPRLKEKFATEWRTETATDFDVWDPDANTGYFPGAPELEIFTGYQPGADGETCPQAATEAARLLVLYSTLKGQYQIDWSPNANQMTDRLLPGDVVSLTHPQMGLDTGPLFRTLQVAWQVSARGATASAVIGFQT